MTKFFFVALLVVVAVAFAEARSLRSLKRSKFIRSIAPVSARLARSAQEPDDVEALVGLAVLDELTGEKRSIDAKKRHLSRRETSSEETSSEEAAEVLLGLALLDELSGKSERKAKKSVFKPQKKSLFKPAKAISRRATKLSFPFM
uniref:Venom toxin putative n=1 Tax=Pandinus cavimanus TaxID=217261 RepID=H2CYN5_PANCV|nr:venom toxin putative [Pandinus cavimanus]